MTLWSFSTWKEWCQRLDTWPRAMVFKLFLPAKLFVYFYGTCGGDRSLIYKERCMFAGPEHTLPTVLIQSQHLGDHFEKPQACGNQERRGWKGNTGKKDVMKMIKIIAAHFFWDLPVYQVPQKIPVCLRKKKKKDKLQCLRQSMALTAENTSEGDWIVCRQATGQIILKNLSLTSVDFSLHCSVGMDLSRVRSRKKIKQKCSLCERDTGRQVHCVAHKVTHAPQ